MLGCFLNTPPTKSPELRACSVGNFHHRSYIYADYVLDQDDGRLICVQRPNRPVNRRPPRKQLPVCEQVE